MPNQSPHEQLTLAGKFMRFLAQFAAGLVWIFVKIVNPVRKQLWRFARWVYWIYYHQIWQRFVYLKSGRFSRARAGVLIISTGALLMAMAPAPHFLWQAGMFAFVREYETLYLSLPQELDFNEDVHAVRGCEKLECSEEDTVYFRVRPTLFNHVWAMVERGHPFYADRTASVVSTASSECKVLSYGFRWTWLLRNTNIYPEMLDAVCKPIGAQ